MPGIDIFAIFLRKNAREIGKKLGKFSTSKRYKSNNMTDRNLKFVMEVPYMLNNQFKAI